MRLLKRIFIGFLIFVVLLIGAAFALIARFDPNAVKPTLKQQLAEQNIFAQLEGDIEWQIWPEFGLKVNKAALFNNAEHSGEALAELEQIALVVDLVPLLSRQIRIQAIDINGLKLDYVVYADRISNWDTLISATDPESADAQIVPEPSEESAPIDFAIANISLAEIHFTYRDLSQASLLRLSIDSLQLSNVNLTGDAMHISGFGIVQSDGLPALTYDIDGYAKYNQTTGLAELSLSNATISSPNQAARLDAAMTLEAALDRENITALVDLSTPSARRWLQALNIDIAEAITSDYLNQAQLKLSAEITSSNQASAEAEISFDETQLHGDLHYDTKGAIPEINTRWQGTQINLDNYLPNTTDTTKAEENPNTTAQTDLPLEQIRSLNLDAHLNFEEVRINKIPLTDIQTHIEARDGVVTLKKLNVHLHEGSVLANAKLDARLGTARLNYNAELVNIDIGFIATNLADFDMLEGSVSGKLNGSSEGNNTDILLDNLRVNASMTSEQIRIAPVNLLKLYCEALAVIEGEPRPKQNWVKYTDISTLAFNGTFANGVASLEHFHGALENVNTRASGTYELTSGKFDFPLKLSLEEVGDSTDSCNFIDEQWKDRPIPFHCKGSIDQVGITTCLPDTSYIEDVARARIKKEMEKGKDKIEQRLQNEAERLLEKHLDGDTVDKLKQLFK